METTNAPFRQTEDLPPRAEMYRALVERDGSYEGVFYLGVRTTGIFCLPPARRESPSAKTSSFSAARARL